MRVLALCGSPRRNGNSSSLARVALDACEARGASTVTVHTATLSLSGCRGCDGCKKSFEQGCIVEDDMASVYAELEACDAVLLATPIYFYNVSSWLKAPIDRLYGLLAPDPNGETHISRLAPGKHYYFLSTQEDREPMWGYTALAIIAQTLDFWFGMSCQGSLIATEVVSPDDWRNRPELVHAARNLIQTARYSTS